MKRVLGRLLRWGWYLAAIVLVVWAADMPAYHALVQRLLTQDANVRQVKAYFSVMRAKFEPAIGLPAAQARTSSAKPPR